MPQISAI